nr:MAG TPA: hypothetical protein [Caudoviricetes sp.]
MCNRLEGNVGGQRMGVRPTFIGLTNYSKSTL